MRWSVTLITLLFLISSIALLGLLPTLLRQKIGIPNALPLHDAKVLRGERPSGKYGFKLLEEITKNFHPYNSNDNQIVREVLVSAIKDIIKAYESWNCSQPLQFEFLEDSVNMEYININNRVFFESNNILLRVNGKRNESLLVSAHYDSAIESYGATDDGVAVCAVVSTISAVARKTCHDQLHSSVIFNLNNGEEIDMLGASSFTLHPAIKSVKAFLNLDGSGATETFSSFLLRTNSFALVSLLMKTSPFPHSSIIANNIMRFLHSDTDYTPYSQSMLPGADYAFYSYRYLYHSMRDSINHTSAKSLQHMADNLFAAVNVITEGNALERVHIDEGLEASTGAPPIPSFLFFDRFGLFGIAETKFSFLVSVGLLITVVLMVGIVKVSFGLTRGVSSLWNQELKPALNSFLLVLFAFILSLSGGLFFSMIKTYINPGSSYGNPEASLASIVILVLLMFSLAELIWPSISLALRLTSTPLIAVNRFERLPESEPLLPFTDQEDESEDEEEEGHNDSDSSDFQDPLPGRIAPSPLASRVEHPHHHHHHKSKVLCAWFPIGMLGFWILLLSFGAYATFHGISIFYFIFDFALFALVNLFVSLFMEHYYARYYLYRDITIPQTVTEIRFIDFYENYFFYSQIVISTLIPFLFMADLMYILILGIPAVIGEGVSGVVIDLLFTLLVSLTLLNVMPFISQTDRKKSVVILFVLFLFLWIPQFFLFPYSVSRPFKYDFGETFDLSGALNSTIVSISIMAGMTMTEWAKNVNVSETILPSSLQLISKHTGSFSYEGRPHNASDLMMNVDWKNANGTINGIFTGSSHSRVCSLTFPTLNLTSILLIDPASNWKVYGNANATFDQHLPSYVFRRQYPDGGNERVTIPFTLRNVSVATIGNPIILKSRCYLPMTVYSRTYQDFLSVKPEWTNNGISSNFEQGRFIVEKTFEL